MTELAPAWVNAGPDEQVVLRTSAAWLWRLRLAAAWAVFGVAVCWTSWPTTALGWILRTLESMVVLALIAGRLAPRHLVVTTERILTIGLGRSVNEIRIDDILALDVIEDQLSRRLRSSAISLRGQARERLRFAGTADADAIRAAVVAGRQQAVPVRSLSWVNQASVWIVFLVVIGTLLYRPNHPAPPSPNHAASIGGVGPTTASSVIDRKTAADLVMNSYLLNLLGGDYQHAYNLLCAAGREHLDETEFEAYVGKPSVLHYDVANSYLEAEQYVYIVYFDYTDHSYDTVRLTVVTQDDGLRVCDGPGLRQQN